MNHALRATWAIALCLLCLPCAGSEQAVPAAGRSVTVNDIEMYFEEAGAGEPLLLLHGFGGCDRDWQAFSAPLSAHFRVIVPHLRGHGRSTNPLGTFTHRQVADDLLALLDRLDIARFKAIGISSGGMALLHMATREPSRVEAMVLVGAAHYFPEQARAITRGAAERGPRPGDVDYFRLCATQGDAQVEALVKQFADFSKSFDDVNFTPPLLSTIRARTLIVHGDRDEFFPVDIAVEMYGAIRGSALWIVPQGSHVPVFGPHAREFQDVALRFLRETHASP